jgi:hypothetical protein
MSHFAGRRCLSCSNQFNTTWTVGAIRKASGLSTGTMPMRVRQE